MGDYGAVVLCSHGNWAVLPRDGVEDEVVPFLRPLTASFSSSIKSSLYLNHLDLDERFFRMRQTWFLLAVKMLQETPWCFVGIGNFSNRTTVTVQLWGFQFSPAWSSGKCSFWERAPHHYQSKYRAFTICRKPTVLCQSSIYLWRLGADCPSAPLCIQGLQLEALLKEGSVQQPFTDLILQVEEPEKVELELICPFYVQ